MVGQRYCVIGGAGFIGSHFVDSLLGRDDVEAVTAFDNFSAGRRWHVAHHDADDRFRLVEGDIRDEFALTAAVRGHDTVVHLAMHRRAALEGGATFRLNVEATRDLLALCERHPNVRRFVFRSFSEVYEVRPNRPSLIAEDHPLNLSRKVPQWIRDRVAADLGVCTRMGMSPLTMCVLRSAECLAPSLGSQIYDYLQSSVCLKPLGYDPMLNLLSLEDIAIALELSIHSEAQGIFNIPGADTLPLSEVIDRWGCTSLPLPGPVLSPLYRLRAAATGTDFRYDLNFWRFHFSGVLDGKRARDVLGYTPANPLYWPNAAYA